MPDLNQAEPVLPGGWEAGYPAFSNDPCYTESSFASRGQMSTGYSAIANGITVL